MNNKKLKKKLKIIIELNSDALILIKAISEFDKKLKENDDFLTFLLKSNDAYTMLFSVEGVAFNKNMNTLFTDNFPMVITSFESLLTNRVTAFKDIEQIEKLLTHEGIKQ
jgi:hypothetical protein